MLNRGLDKVELLRIVEAVANEKSIDKEIVLESIESAIQKAALTKFGTENNIRVIIDRLNGEIQIQKVLDIVDSVEDSSKQIILNDAISIEKNKYLKI
jgi:N utilization substance protein A